MSEDMASPAAPTWFPYGTQDLPGWRFDVVTLLAIIGESSVAEHAQTVTASHVCLLPRMIPAPQALLRANRPQRLPEVTAKMAGVYSGVVLDTVGFFANIIYPLDGLKPFAFHVVEIKHKHLNTQPGSETTRASLSPRSQWIKFRTALASRLASKGAPKNSTLPGTPLSDLEANHAAPDIVEPPLDPKERPPPAARRTVTMTAKIAEMVNPSQRYFVPLKTWAPVHILSIFSFALTWAIVGAAIYWKDGAAVVAMGLVSLSSTVICYASRWRPRLMSRPTQTEAPKGDVIIRTREGAFVLVRCTEEVARELYSGTEECDYVCGRSHRAFMALGMVLLMVSVLLLGNCGWNSQVFIGVSYILLNGLYWLLGLVPASSIWDLSRYEKTDQTPKDAEDADTTTNEKDEERKASFTRTLWYAIRETKATSWAERSGAVPNTDQWKEWLEEAVNAAKSGNRSWPAVERKNAIMKKSAGKEMTDQAGQVAPLLLPQSLRRRETLGQGTSS